MRCGDSFRRVLSIAETERNNRVRRIATNFQDTRFNTTQEIFTQSRSALFIPLETSATSSSASGVKITASIMLLPCRFEVNTLGPLFCGTFNRTVLSEELYSACLQIRPPQSAAGPHRMNCRRKSNEPSSKLDGRHLVRRSTAFRATFRTICRGRSRASLGRPGFAGSLYQLSASD